ncbi:hypothetical protein [uncultured Deinococcus sp.]|uniref:hypothetical protein n=1 Tax=uncultured Deinococcus sp. TaxID=158789 RepID=UPI0025CD6316|nr:hypothetical protein [uncultured Deinococcus sp.]
MTTREEAKAKLDALSETEFQQVVDFLDAQQRRHHAQADELARLLDVLAEPLPGAEQDELLRDLEHRQWRSGTAEDRS